MVIASGNQERVMMAAVSGDCERVVMVVDTERRLERLRERLETEG